MGGQREAADLLLDSLGESLATVWTSQIDLGENGGCSRQRNQQPQRKTQRRTHGWSVFDVGPRRTSSKPVRQSASAFLTPQVHSELFYSVHLTGPWTC